MTDIPISTTGLKKCRSCGNTQPLGNFYLTNGRARPDCKVCDNRRRSGKPIGDHPLAKQIRNKHAKGRPTVHGNGATSDETGFVWDNKIKRAFERAGYSLHDAGITTTRQIVEMTLKQAEEIGHTSGRMFKPIQHAVRNGHAEAIKALLPGRGWKDPAVLREQAGLAKGEAADPLGLGISFETEAEAEEAALTAAGEPTTDEPLEIESVTVTEEGEIQTAWVGPEDDLPTAPFIAQPLFGPEQFEAAQPQVLPVERVNIDSVEIKSEAPHLADDPERLFAVAKAAQQIVSFTDQLKSAAADLTEARQMYEAAQATYDGIKASLDAAIAVVARVASR
jgi:hypothetical protein